MTYLALLLLSLCLDRVQYMVTKFNISARWNGYGAIAGVLDKRSDARMVYRVLVPWIIGRNKSLWKYQLWQTIFIFVSMLSIYKAWGTPLVFIIAILISMTF